MKRLVLFFFSVLVVTLVLLVAGPLAYYGYIYYSGYRHGVAIEITVTPPIVPAVAPIVAPLTAVNPAEDGLTEAPVTSIRLVPVVAGLVQPTYLTHAFDDRLFITEKGGLIRIVENGILLPDPFLDVTGLVGSEGSEQGLLSVAFHPDYARNGRFFINYTNQQGHTVLARYQTDPDKPNQALADSATILFLIGQPFAVHNGGQLHFGPDGYLYVAVGDGGTTGDYFNNAQNLTNLLGTILRLDVDRDDLYAIPSDNPFVDDDDKRNEIWVYGLRNPWRFSFDRQTGDLFIADVGQFGWEEINFQPAGSAGNLNYGWNILEGSYCYKAETCQQEGFVLPVAEYSHGEGGCAISGGYIYRGSQFPGLRGNYFFGDYCTGKVWSLFRHDDGRWQRTIVAESQAMVSSFGEDISGELYLLDFRSGTIFQIEEEPGG
jgi:glucose/arabinose dehydrogenase